MLVLFIDYSLHTIDVSHMHICNVWTASSNIALYLQWCCKINDANSSKKMLSDETGTIGDKRTDQFDERNVIMPIFIWGYFLFLCNKLYFLRIGIERYYHLLGYFLVSNWCFVCILDIVIITLNYSSHTV